MKIPVLVGVCCICFSNTLKQILKFIISHLCVCCICFSNTLKRQGLSDFWSSVCVVFVLAILSNKAQFDATNGIVCVVFVLAILSNIIMFYIKAAIVCVVFVLAILSNMLLFLSGIILCVLYLF